MRIVGLLPQGMDDSRIRSALAPSSFAVFRCDADLMAFLARTVVHAVIVGASDTRSTSSTTTVLELRKRFPSVLVVVYWASGQTGSSVCAAVRAGADEVVIAGVDDSRERLTHTLREASRYRLATTVHTGLVGILRPDALSFVDCCLNLSWRPFGVARLAVERGVSPRTLSSHCRMWGLPEPRVVIAWTRLLLATHLLADPGRSVEQVADALGFGAGAGLHNMFRRHVALRPSSIRTGGAQLVLERFKELLVTTAINRGLPLHALKIRGAFPGNP